MAVHICPGCEKEVDPFLDAFTVDNNIEDPTDLGRPMWHSRCHDAHTDTLVVEGEPSHHDLNLMVDPWVWQWFGPGLDSPPVAEVTTPKGHSYGMAMRALVAGVTDPDELFEMNEVVIVMRATALLPPPPFEVRLNGRTWAWMDLTGVGTPQEAVAFMRHAEDGRVWEYRGD